jgi:hypothetical protein
MPLLLNLTKLGVAPSPPNPIVIEDATGRRGVFKFRSL